MKTTVKLVTATIIGASSAYAASGAQSDENGLLVNLFLAFGAVIVAFQLIPGVMLFGAMLKGLFTREEKETL